MPRQIMKVGKYPIVEKLSKGGMGEIYIAKHPTLKRLVILKRLTFRGGREVTKRFAREASIMMDFRDEHIVQVYDHFKDGSSYYIVMEYVDGYSLDELIMKRGKLHPKISLLIFYEICRALKYAHDRHVIHRDVKPANILVSKEGEVKLTDFGIATSPEEKEEITKVGMTMGTPSYMSPEQIADPRSVDERADIYSAGAVLYQLVTGKPPFSPAFNVETLAKITKGAYKSPRKISNGLPFIVRRLIRKAMNRKYQRRYKNVDVIIGKLSKYVRGMDQKGINTLIKNYLIEEGGSPSELKSKRGLFTSKLQKVVGIAVILAVLLIGGYFFVKEGYFYKYFRSGSYGKLVVQVQFPSNYSKPPDLIHPYLLVKGLNRVKVSSSTGSERRYILKPLRNRLMDTILKKASKEKSAQLYTTGKLFIPVGNYELDLWVENCEWVSSFYLDSWKQQKRVQHKKNTKDMGKIIRYTYRSPDSHPIKLIHNLYDNRTGKSIYSRAKIQFFLAERNKWIDWKRYNSNSYLKASLAPYLKSGKSYFFKYIVPGYYPKTMKIRVEKRLDIVNVNVYLEKK